MSSELSAILEKMKHNMPREDENPLPGTAPTPSIPLGPFQEYLTNEIEVLEKRQLAAQEAVEAKAKELQSLRENLLVVSGALQGVQHVKRHVHQQQPTPSPLPVTTLLSKS